ncbi:MAG: SidA/IucD/PvdA family monooxygenase [Gemmatimonadetes bacterium]|nr:SidA/IucD/PvdA family monooxygenase [Gemmatimonadota bacterium]MYA65226.1 SidA/IucD/PvdA family monooxygenase [Gemmatimonadota bacterium]MYB99160.1 SidA/IucD/PvdA family monooxygenase [Gemmatimonadota bacterium]MYH54471.1 SidA/IucD/PvdA family monooxygenase [Gemmatimonadota bacterium]MYI46564.1 SidA/IucD/PvdA family monooxygenase [Gemmatimonadota bacterium]
MTKEARSFDVVIVGAGAAGIGFGVTLRHLGIESFAILDRAAVGASFLRWPRQTRFITPSFASNQFGLLDLNAVCLDTSPAFSVGVEHPTGAEYAHYLRGVAEHFELPVQTGIDVLSVARSEQDKRFRVETSRGHIRAGFVVWAGGEMQYPRTHGFHGAELCLHYANVTSWDDLGGGERCIIGGAESGVDAAVALAAAGRQAVVFDREEPWNRRGSDPSQHLSPFTRARLISAIDSGRGRVTLRGGCTVTGVRRNGNGYQVALEDGDVVNCAERPILATGFVGSASLVRPLFDWRDEYFPLVTENDESTVTKGLFLVGPQVRHGDLIFCFIYKFRQRFAVVANQIADRLRVSTEALESYRRYAMYLDDLSCCGGECAC